MSQCRIVCYLLIHPLPTHVTPEAPEDTPFTWVLRNAMVRGEPESLWSSAVAVLCGLEMTMGNTGIELSFLISIGITGVRVRVVEASDSP